MLNTALRSLAQLAKPAPPVDSREQVVGKISSRVFLGAMALFLFYVLMRPTEAIRSFDVLGNGLRYGQFESSFLVLKPVQTGEPGLNIIDKDAAVGFRMVLGYIPDLGDFGVRIFSPDGASVHTIPVNLQSLNPKEDVENYIPHAFYPLTDGSVVINSDDGRVMARLNMCGEALWARRGVFHHSLSPADDGTLWTWLGTGENAYGAAQAMVRIDPDRGQTLEAISLDDVLNKASENERLAFGVGPTTRIVGDLFHPNDVEPLPEAFAELWPGFPPGALLVSFRAPNLIAVLHPRTHDVLWSANGPWIKQHDPDWSPTGEILLLNNNTLIDEQMPDRNWQMAARSNVLAVSINEGRTKVRYYPTIPFATNVQGKIELLPGGGLMVVAPEQGRVFEVDQAGRLTADFHNRSRSGWYGRVTDAKFLPTDFFSTEPAQYDCGGKA